ncbi:4-hydroxythreonine-4-phosphate dehydrogenase [Andreprevotia lacus DSM 23236]|jgi:4-hydroxythreonine-4-phosphate dehydrogenase|uniref:4-hydroxythreonine-4-phosphate dehydrogenase n=1 Tax=Andreprevotia lacus DSM 23236 TaxID=1121001 RepID=A0A1W1Y0B3_9NEIS|nr:4-hydroxythreonine-4-phosphate dehydrogenase PdxA [Andreprevotia lacus]SMC29567.1 4-hydroxythreonine-4-phosphate dehydrogenase [Andreprevotia lacus DSM 23236]
MTARAVLAITTGEPAGVGPELAARIAADGHAARLVLIGDRALIAGRATAIGIDADWPEYRPDADDAVAILHVPLTRPAVAGELDTANARYVLDTLDIAIDGCQEGRFDAMVTAPLHKGVINEGCPGKFFSGHTEYLADHTNTRQVVMMLVGGGLRVALATTHLPLQEVSAALTADSLATTLAILHDDLRSKFGIDNPRILVAGLNPHAGESGHLGREEIDVIEPVLEKLRATGMQLTGPLPADTLFQPKYLQNADAVLAMYHDQGLPVLKFASFGNGVNLTLGLPIIRTSVDHGTALDLAGKGTADAGSLRAAVALAAELASHHAA